MNSSPDFALISLVVTRSHALEVALINMQIIKPHLHSLIGTQVSRIFYRLQRGDV